MFHRTDSIVNENFRVVIKLVKDCSRDSIVAIVGSCNP